MSYNPNPPTGYPPAGYPPPKKSRTGVIALLVGLLMLGAGAAGTYFYLDSQDDSTDTASGETFGEVFGEKPGEILLEPANEVGPKPFSAKPFAQASTQSMIRPVSTNSTIAPGGTTPARSGREPGLYGGTNDNTLCDAADIVKFLAENPDKAQAWVTALNKDPDVIADWGEALTVSDVGRYIATLTPVFLQTDVRVTNNGYSNGQATPRQAVLQKGSAVLVDQSGVPRVRCFCGNPLTAPQPSATEPKFGGGTEDWKEPNDPEVVRPGPKTNDGFEVTRDPDGGIVTTPKTPNKEDCEEEPTFEEYEECVNGARTVPPTDADPVVDPPAAALEESTVVPPDNGTPPVIESSEIVRDPSADGDCQGGDVAYSVSLGFSDVDGDVGSTGIAVEFLPGRPYQVLDKQAITGDSSRGTAFGTVCAAPGTPLNFVINDQAGNPSSTVGLATPAEAPTAVPTTPPAPTAVPEPPAPQAATGPDAPLTTSPKVTLDPNDTFCADNGLGKDYIIELEFKDDQGDAARPLVDLGNGPEEVLWTLVSGDGSSGTVQVFVCGQPGAAGPSILMEDAAGNRSSTRSALFPPDPPSGPGSAPTLGNVTVERNPSRDQSCKTNFSNPASQAYITVVPYTDADGDVTGLESSFNGGGFGPATIRDSSGNASSGLFTNWICGEPGDGVEYQVVDTQGNTSPSLFVGL